MPTLLHRDTELFVGISAAASKVAILQHFKIVDLDVHQYAWNSNRMDDAHSRMLKGKEEEIL